MKLGKWALCLCLLGSLFLQSHALAQASPASKGKASVFSFENTRLGGFYQDDKNGPLWLAADMLDGYPAFAQLLQQNQKDTSRSSPLLGEPCFVPSSPISVIPHLCISI